VTTTVSGRKGLFMHKPVLGLKSHWSKEQLDTRLKLTPSLIEIYLANGDLEYRYDEVKDVCESLRDKGIRIILHQPLKFNDEHINIAIGECQQLIYSLECIEELDSLGFEFIMHPYNHYPETEQWIDYTTDPKYKEHIALKRSSESLINIILNYGSKNMYLENVYLDVFSSADDINYVIKKTNVKFCLDISHLFLMDSKNFYSEFKKLKPDLLHINDASKVDDAIEVGKGLIDFSLLKLNVDGIVEVANNDDIRAVETIRSYNKIKDMYGY